MLVLSRKEKESLLIGEDIEVTVTKIEGDVVRLGIRAPKTIGIYRREILTQVSDNNREALLKNINDSKVARVMDRGELN